MKMTRARTLRSAACLALTTGLLSTARAQEGAQLDLLLNNLGLYLLAYEADLSTVVASERYEQQEIRPVRRTRNQTFNTAEIVRSRRLDSEVAFLRLPGGASWLGVRDVLKVDGRPVTTDSARLLVLLKRFGRVSDLDDAARITAASSLHNLGGVRTINMPTTPLELLHPDHHVQYLFKLRGTDKIDGVMTMRIEFEEFDEPTIIDNPEGDPLFIRGSAWVEPETGRLWRAEFTVRPKSSTVTPRSFQARLRVDYTLHSELKMLVPKEMTEDFFVPGGRGVGKAKYSNFRQFNTASRIVPQR